MTIKKELLIHINRWKDKHIITSSQKTEILKDLNNESSTNNFFKIIATIGSFFIGLGILLLISSNWEYLPKMLKLILILALPTLPLVIGYHLSYIKQEFKKIGDSLIMLSSLLIGASSALIGQLYNIDGSLSGLLLKWCILTIPLTIIFRFKVLSTITISTFYLTILYYTLNTYQFYSGEVIILRIFTFLPLVIILISYFSRKHLFQSNKYESIQKIFELVSIKVILLTLLISTLSTHFYMFGETILSNIIQNLLFLASIFGIMWFSNKEHNLILRNSTFFWLGAYMILRYFDWFWDYAQTGVFFVIFGLLLLASVYGYIKVTNSLDNKANNNKY